MCVRRRFEAATLLIASHRREVVRNRRPGDAYRRRSRTDGRAKHRAAPDDDRLFPPCNQTWDNTMRQNRATSTCAGKQSGSTLMKPNTAEHEENNTRKYPRSP